MATTTKRRQDLKAYFVKNAIPTEGNFSDLIDAPLNQADDGVFKLPGEPLSVVAATGDQRRTLRLYADYPSVNADWLISLRPAQDPANAATVRNGFGIADGAGNTRLFIDSSTGHLGVGTNNPQDRGHVSGGNLRVSSNAGLLKLDGTDHAYIEYYPAGVASGRKAWLGYGGAGQTTFTLQNDQGDIALVGTSVKSSASLSVTGTVSATVSLTVGSSTLTSKTLTVGSSNSTYPLDVTTTATGGGWSRLVVSAETLWGDAASYVTIGAGGATGIMIANPHVPWYSSEKRASIRYGRTGGTANKTYWDAGVRDDGRFSFVAYDDGAAGEALAIDKAGLLSVKLGMKVTGVQTGTANDYQKAQVTLSGGGTVTWSSDYYLKWTNRFIAIGMERGTTFSSGYMDINPPSASTTVTAWDSSNRLDTTKGIRLGGWEALYAVHEVGKGNGNVTLQIVNYASGTWSAPSNWVLVAVVNSDDGSLKLGTGATIASTSTYASAYGSSVPKGAILMWSGSTIPVGWAICDGSNSTPDLRGRFILASGTGSGLTARSIGNTGGEERHTLTVAELPSHNHGVSDPGHYHNWTAGRQQAGTDDNNNTQELSHGDRGSSDTMSKDTDTRYTGISIGYAGSSSSHENMPPYYVLAFIMKL